MFAVEPSVEVAEGRIGVEEDVLITENGGVFLTQPQQELILIRLQK